MELQFVHVKILTLVLHQIVDQNVPLTLNVHKIKRAININARILVMEHAELMQVSRLFILTTIMLLAQMFIQLSCY